MTADDRRPAPPTEHPDLDTLADLHAGALDDAAAARVRAHAAGCRQCTAALAALDAVRVDLRALPTPTIPAPVAARLDATLADLRAQAGDPRTGAGDLPAGAGDPHTAAGDPRAGAGDPRAGASGPGMQTGEPRTEAASSGPPPEELARRRAVQATDELALARDRRRRRLTRGLGAAAAAVAVIAAGASVTAIVRSGGGSNTGTSAAGSSASTTSGGAGTAGRSGQLAPEDGTAVPGDTSVAIPSYDREGLRRALPSIVRAAPVGQAGGAGGAGETGPAGAMADAGRRTACAGSIRDTRGSLRAVQRISYRNQPAYVFVYDDNGQLTGYVVADGCGTAAALPAVLLDTVS